MMKQCPSLQQWLDLTEGRLPSEESARLESHRNSGCSDCEAQWGWIERIRQSLPATEGPRFSRESRSYLRELAAVRLAPRPRRLWIARLLLDTRQQPIRAGARGEAEAVQLRYETDAGEVRLWAEPSGREGWYLIGQVFSKAENLYNVPETATLTRKSEDGTYTARTEDTEFHFLGVSPGAYRLEIRLADSIVLVPEIALGKYE